MSRSAESLPAAARWPYATSASLAGRPTRPPVALLSLAAALAVWLIVPWIAMSVANGVQADLAWFDPDAAFVYPIAHKVLHAGLALGLMAAFGLVLRRPLAEWGLRIGDWPKTVRVVAVFAVVVTTINIVVDGLPFILSDTQPGIAFWPTPLNIAGVLVFQWVVVGIGEELLFRGLIPGLLAPAFGRRVRLGFFDISLAGIIGAVLFAAAHGIYYAPSSFLAVTWEPSWAQVAYAFVLGIYYSALKERTGSLLGPIISHGIADGTLWVVTFVAIGMAG